MQIMYETEKGRSSPPWCVCNLWKTRRRLFKKNLGMRNSQCEHFVYGLHVASVAGGPTVLSGQMVPSSLSVSYSHQVTLPSPPLHKTVLSPPRKKLEAIHQCWETWSHVPLFHDHHPPSFTQLAEIGLSSDPLLSLCIATLVQVPVTPSLDDYGNV